MVNCSTKQSFVDHHLIPENDIHYPLASLLLNYNVLHFSGRMSGPTGFQVAKLTGFGEIRMPDPHVEAP